MYLTGTAKAEWFCSHAIMGRLYDTFKHCEMSLAEISVFRVRSQILDKMFESSFPVFVSSFRCHFLALFCRPFCNFVLFRVIVSSFRCVTFLLRFVVPLAISSCLRPVSSFPCLDSSLLSSFRHFDVSFRRFVSPFRFAVLIALDWERERYNSRVHYMKRLSVTVYFKMFTIRI